MLDFQAFFCGNLVYIDGRAYKCNETLTACLSLSETELNDCLVSLWRLAASARLKGVSAEQLRLFLGYMQRAHELFARIKSLAGRLPIFSSTGLYSKLTQTSLPGLLDRLCSDGSAAGAEIDEIQDYTDFYFLRIAFRLSSLPGPKAAEELNSLSLGIADLFEQYITLTEDFLQARRVYSELLDKYIHKKRAFPSGAELAACLSRYRDDCAPSDAFHRLPEPGALKCSYKAFTDEDGQEHFSLCFVFSRLRDFFYIDFFRGLECSHLPTLCENCGRYFLLAGGKYSSYCNSPLPDDPQKTCRSVGARKRYGSKCKTDPVWLTYNRAYKTHYARYMKGKMSSGEFERWSRYAVSLREQAADGTLSAAQYERLIKE